MESRFSRDQERKEWRIPRGYEVVLVQRRVRRTVTRPAARTVRSEALAFQREALAQLRAFGTDLWRELLSLVGIS